jgi:hypothetical protein
MTAGARSGLKKLHRQFGDQLRFVSIYVREAHPGERYPHHTSDQQKMEHASDWAEQDGVPWTVAVDSLDGTVHQAYGSLPNAVYLIDLTGRVAFRALWAGQERLLRAKVKELFDQEAAGRSAINLGQRENMIVPLLHGGAEFEHALGRGGRKSLQDFKREMGTLMYGMEKLMSKFQPLIHPGYKPENKGRS